MNGKESTMRGANVQYIPLSVWEKAAEEEEILVPIRLQIEQDGYKYRDDFTWNLNEKLIKPEKFAEIICFENKLPPSFIPAITESMNQQLEEFIPFTPSPDIEELRMIIKLDITIDGISLIDQFEWDINCSANSPELFAETMAAELCLSNEFKVRIAHAIREQIAWFVYELRLSGYDFTSKDKIFDPILIECLGPDLKYGECFRTVESTENYTPIISELDESDLQKHEHNKEREDRRRRRQSKLKTESMWSSRAPQKIEKSSLVGTPNLGPLSQFSVAKNPTNGKLEFKPIKNLRPKNAAQTNMMVMHDFDDEDEDPNSRMEEEKNTRPPSPAYSRRDSARLKKYY